MAGIPDPDTLTRQPRAPSAGTIQTVEFDDPPSPEEAVAEAREKLRLADERASQAERRAVEEVRRRTEAESRLTEAHGAAFSSQERSIASSIQAAQATIDRAKSDLVAAITNADPVAQADAQERLAQASADLSQFNAQKTYYESERTRLAEEAKRPQPQNQRVDAVEVTTPGGRLQVAVHAKDWMDKHPKFYSDRDYYNHAVAAHSSIIADGITDGSPAYFRELDKEMANYEGYQSFRNGEQQPDSNLSQRQQQRRQASSFGAPASRAPTQPRSQGGPVTWQQVARLPHLAGDGSLTESDLRDAAKWAGYARGKTHNGKRFASDDDAFTQYLNDQMSDRDSGLKQDQNFRWE
jgi:hypothetical protein